MSAPVKLPRYEAFTDPCGCTGVIWMGDGRRSYSEPCAEHACPWMDPRYPTRCSHPDHTLRKQPEVYCSCLLPKDRLFLRVERHRGGAFVHTGTAECCSDFCGDCGVRYCFACGCYQPDDREAADGVDWGFAEPCGRSALRAATGDRCIAHGCHGKVSPRDSFCRHCGEKLNPRKHPCPSCDAPDVLTDADVDHGYQCNVCADRAEGTYVGADY